MSDQQELDIEDGGSLRVISADGDRISVASTKPAPPGATLRAHGGGVEDPLLVKVHRCRREPGDPPAFRIDGRVVNITRARRQWLVEQLG